MQIGIVFSDLIAGFDAVHQVIAKHGAQVTIRLFETEPGLDPFGFLRTWPRSEKLAQFVNQRYLRVSPLVPARMWFAQDNDVLYAYARADTVKVRRIGDDSRVRVIPCFRRGRPQESIWVEGEARIVDGAAAERGHQLLNQKYVWLKWVRDLLSRLTKREQVVIAIRVS